MIWLNKRLARRDDEGSLLLAILFILIGGGILAVMLSNALTMTNKSNSTRNLTNAAQGNQQAAQDALYLLNKKCTDVAACAASGIPVAPAGFNINNAIQQARTDESCRALRAMGQSFEVDPANPSTKQWGSWFIGALPSGQGSAALGTKWGGSGAYETKLYTVSSYESGSAGGRCRIEVSNLNGMAVSSATEVGAGRLAYSLTPEAAAQYTLFSSNDNITGGRTVTAVGGQQVRIGTNNDVTVPGNAATKVDLFSSDGTRGDDNNRCHITGCAPRQIEAGVALDSNLIQSYCSSLGMNDGKAGDGDPRSGWTDSGKKIGDNWYSRDADANGDLVLGTTALNSQLLASSIGGGTALCYRNVRVVGTASLFGTGDVNIFLTGDLTVGNASTPGYLNWIGDTSTTDAGASASIPRLSVYSAGQVVALASNSKMRATVYAPNANCITTGTVSFAGSLACKKIDLSDRTDVFSRAGTASIYLKDLYSPRLIWSAQRGPVATGVGVSNR